MYLQYMQFDQVNNKKKLALIKQSAFLDVWESAVCSL